MNFRHLILLTVFFAFCFSESAVSQSINIGARLSWSTATGRFYQLQRQSGEEWTNVGELTSGNGSTGYYTQKPEEASLHSGIYRMVETIPERPNILNSFGNGSFEAGSGDQADGWNISNNIHDRVEGSAYEGTHYLRTKIVNVGNTPRAGLLEQRISNSNGTAVVGGKTYSLSFKARQISSGPSYVQNYNFQWLNASGEVIQSTGNRSFSGGSNGWETVEAANMSSPADAVDAKIVFYFATGAVAGGHGEVWLDDMRLETAADTPLPEETNIVELTHEPAAILSWQGDANIIYQVRQTGDLATEPWSDLDTLVGDNSRLYTSHLILNEDAGFFRVDEIDFPDLDFSQVTPLYHSETALEPEVLEETPTALITRMADRARDRHAREDFFSAYDHYLPFYWEQRVANLEIIDRVAKGGSGVTFNFSTHGKMNPAEFRTFYGNTESVALYHNNQSDNSGGVTLESTNASVRYPGETEYNYTSTITQKSPEGRALQIGDRIEVELSQFILSPGNGRPNYYGTAFLYVVGQGVVPWYAKYKEEATNAADRDAASFDSYPLPETAWLGGRTTLPYQYSDEPEHRFKQTAGNISSHNGHEFMLGRRLHHTNFLTGAHSESGNPVFSDHVGKSGPHFVAESCVSCHINNGRSLPPSPGAPLSTFVVKVGRDPLGRPHPVFGEQLQTSSTQGDPESVVTLAGYDEIPGTYADGTPYSLRRPVYQFSGERPAYFSVRAAPPLIGMGLLEALDEATIADLADPDDLDGDGISGRLAIVPDSEDSELYRIGRFTQKGSQAKIVHQISRALSFDMGVSNPIYPKLEGDTSATVEDPEIDAGDLDRFNLYVSLLGVSARRSLTDATALQGEQLFTSAGCSQCHVAELTTGSHHPMSELRNQTIHPYTDLLLHDMGSGLADTMGEKGARGSEWRTSPLWNIGLTAGVSGGEAYLHDGRARTLEEAILWHGGEGEASKEIFRNMSAEERGALVDFLRSL